MRPVEFMTTRHASIRLAVETQPQGTAQHTFVSGSPLEAFLDGQPQDLVRYASLARPQATRARPNTRSWNRMASRNCARASRGVGRSDEAA